MTWRGLFSGALALIALQALLASDQGGARLGSAFGWIADLSAAALDPTRPAIPDLAGVGENYGLPPTNGDQWGYGTSGSGSSGSSGGSGGRNNPSGSVKPGDTFTGGGPTTNR